MSAALDDPDTKVWLRSLGAAALAFKVSPFVMAQAAYGRHGGEEARARDFAIYLLAIEENKGCAGAAAIVGITKQGVHKAIRRVEELREHDVSVCARLDAAAEVMRAARGAA